jgi:hypothetical protein
MKKKIFTMLVSSFLLAGAFSNVNAQNNVIATGNAAGTIGNYLVTVTVEGKIAPSPDGGMYGMLDCAKSVKFSFGNPPWSPSIIGIITGRGDEITLYCNGVEYAHRTLTKDSASLVDDGYISLSLSTPIPKGSVLSWGYYNKGAVIDGGGKYTYGNYKFALYESPKVSTTLNGKTIYDYYYDRTTQFPGKVQITRTGGSPDLLYSIDGFHPSPFPGTTVSLTELEIQNLIPGSQILWDEPNDCINGWTSLIDVPEHQGILGGTISRPIYIGPVENAKIIPGVSGTGTTHFVPSGKNFVFKIQPTGLNEGLKPEVTTAETRYLPEGVEGITLSESEPGVWTVTILGVQQSLNVNISFGVEPESAPTKTPIVDDGNFQAYGVAGAVKVFNAEGVIELYTIDGRKYNSVPATGGEQTIAAPRGLIIVKNSGKAEKVVVK